MSKHNYKRSFLMAMALGMASGCDRSADILRSTEQAKSARMAETADAGDKGADPAPAGSYSAIAEARHFDVYKHTRTLFDRAEDFMPGHAHDGEGGIMSAIGLFSAVRTGASSAACFVTSGMGED